MLISLLGKRPHQHVHEKRIKYAIFSCKDSGEILVVNKILLNSGLDVDQSNQGSSSPFLLTIILIIWNQV